MVHGRCVLLAERDDRLAEGIRGLLETVFRAVVMVADEPSLKECAGRLQPDLAIVDLSVLRGKGLRVLGDLREACPSVKIIVTSVDDVPIVSRRALEQGADGFVLKHCLSGDLLPAIDAVLRGDQFISEKKARRTVA